MGSDWEETWDARLAALPADEEKYGWYAKLGEIVELNKSAGDEAADPDLYENVKKGLTGGEGHAAIVRDYGPRSRQIAAAIKNLTETSGRAAVQKAEMKSLKLDDLLVAAEAALPIYGELLQTVCDDIAMQHPVEFLRCPKVKAKARAANKVVIKYGGDCSHVKDLVRGTFIFESLEGMYAGIEALVFHPIFNGHAQCIMDFDDRWQEPLSGGYSDCQLLVNIMGHLCELQVNVCVEIKLYGAFVLNHRVVLHAIDATPARWRGGAGSSPLDRTRTAASLSQNDLVKNCQCTRRTG